MTLSDRLLAIGACAEACDLAKGRELRAAWNECDDPTWLLWLLACMADEPGWPTSWAGRHVTKSC